MEKHFITALLVLVLLAPQLGLEAKSRYNEVKERGYDAEERHDDAKKRPHSRYSKSHKKHKKHRHSHRFKAELKKLKRDISDIKDKIEALGQPGGGLHGNLTAIPAALQSEVNENTDELVVVDGKFTGIILDIEGINDSLIANGRIRLAVLESAVMTLESAVMTLESDFAALDLEVGTLLGSTPTNLVYSAVFTKGIITSDKQQALDWADFRSRATGMFSSIEIRNSLGGSVICSDPGITNQIATALNTQPVGGVRQSFTCENLVWVIGSCSSTGEAGLSAISSNSDFCQCRGGAAVTPHIDNPNWGGVSSDFGGSGGVCAAPTQRLEVILGR